jgi:hypothetical protein
VAFNKDYVGSPEHGDLQVGPHSRNWEDPSLRTGPSSE